VVVVFFAKQNECASHDVVVCTCSVQIFIGYIIKQFEFIEQGQMR